MEMIIESQRLALREMSMDDLDFIASMLAHTEVMRYYPKCYSREEAEDWINRQTARYKSHGHGLWLVLDKATEKPVGQVGLSPQTVDGVEEPEIGYLIHRPHWRQGFATEAAIAVRDHAFAKLGKDHVISLIRPVNTPSQGVAGKMGMRPGRTTTFADLEHIVFLLTKEDWERQQTVKWSTKTELSPIQQCVNQNHTRALALI